MDTTNMTRETIAQLSGEASSNSAISLKEAGIYIVYVTIYTIVAITFMRLKNGPFTVYPFFLGIVPAILAVIFRDQIQGFIGRKSSGRIIKFAMTSLKKLEEEATSLDDSKHNEPESKFEQRVYEEQFYEDENFRKLHLEYLREPDDNRTILDELRNYIKENKQKALSDYSKEWTELKLKIDNLSTIIDELESERISKKF